MSVLSKIETSLLLSGRSTIVKNACNARWSYSAGKGNIANAFHKTSNVQYPAMKQLPLPNNVEDIADSEKARFSPTRLRDINGSLLAGDSCRKWVGTNDSRLGCYDSTGSVNLSGNMQSNVPEPAYEQELYTHFNMPGGLRQQAVKYLAADHVATSMFRHYSTNTPKPVEENKTDGYSQLTRAQKLKAAVKEYGVVVIVFHVGISLMSLGTCYLLVTSGFDFSSLQKFWGSTDGAVAATSAAPFIVAYAVHKTFAPVRIGITLVSVPLIVKHLRKIGLMKPPKAKP